MKLLSFIRKERSGGEITWGQPGKATVACGDQLTGQNSKILPITVSFQAKCNTRIRETN